MDNKLAREKLIRYTDSSHFEEAFMQVCFFSESKIDKHSLLSLLHDMVAKDGFLSADDKSDLFSYLKRIEHDNIEYSILLSALKNCIINQLRQSLGYEGLKKDAYDTLSPEIFWPLVVISMKKCLGEKNSKATIKDADEYYKSIGEPQNSFQKNTHDQCIALFSLNADLFTYKTVPELRNYLHPFGSKNKRLKTQKKNLDRVRKQVRKIMQVYKISHNGIEGNILSNGRYKVPDQMAECLRKLFLIK